MQTLASSRGLNGLPRPVGLQRPLRRQFRARLVAVAGKGNGAPPPADASPPAQYEAVPQDIPSYFQPAPPPQLQQGQVYQAVPQYGPPAVPPPSQGFWSSLHPLVYVGIGVVLASLGKVVSAVKGGPQKMQAMAMEQMMKQMMKQMGNAQGGANPFGAPGANPFGAPGSNPFGPPGANPFGAAGANPFGAGSSGFPGMPPAFDTTATPAQPAAPAAAAASAPTASTPASSAISSSSTEEKKAGDGAASSSSSTSGGSAAAEPAKPKKRSAFVDVNAAAASSSSSSSKDGASGNGSEASAGANTATPPPGFGSMPPPGFGSMPPPGFGSMPPPGFSMPPPPSGAGGAAAGGGAEAGNTQGAGAVAGTMLDMLKNPEMQKLLYPYLPEPMRNQETFEWMLNNPEYRSQLEGMLQQQAAATGNPAVQEMMAGMDMSPEKMNAQFDQLGITPDQFLQKVMGDPDLASMMTNPKVMAAIAECTKNPMAIFQYQQDEQVMRVFEKMSELFPQAAGGGSMPSMPPGFGGQMPPGFGPPPTQQ